MRVHAPQGLCKGVWDYWGDSSIGDKYYSSIFDNTKIKRLVPEFRAEILFTNAVKRS